MVYAVHQTFGTWNQIEKVEYMYNCDVVNIATYSQKNVYYVNHLAL